MKVGIMSSVHFPVSSIIFTRIEDIERTGKERNDYISMYMDLIINVYGKNSETICLGSIVTN